METVKKTDAYEIFKKRSGRYAVRDANKNWVSGEEKVKILAEEKLIKVSAPKPKEAEPSAEEPAAEAPAEEEPAAEETPEG